jgi:hypothetical protein
MSSFEIFGSVVLTMCWRELAKGHEFLTKVTRVGRFRLSVKKRKKFEVELDVPNGIIGHHSRTTNGSGSKRSGSMRCFLRYLVRRIKRRFSMSGGPSLKRPPIAATQCFAPATRQHHYE